MASETKYTVNYDDKRFTEVEKDKNAALSDLENTYTNMINQSDKYYQDQINATKDWANTQKKNQQAQTDFAIEQIERQKDQAKQDYTKEQSGAYVDWQKQSNQYGANAEQMAAQGLANTGYAESSMVSMYNTYQNRITAARESYNRAVLNYDNAIKDARLQNNSVLAEIAYEALQQQLELSLQGFQYKNTLIREKAKEKTTLNNTYYERYQDVLAQINEENKLAETVRQHDNTIAMQKAQLEENKRQHNETLALQKAQFAWQKEQAAKSSSGGSIKKSSSGGSSSKKSSSKSKSQANARAKIRENTSSKSKSSSSSAPPIDMQSVLALGYGPISAAKLDQLLAKKEISAYVEDGKMKFKRAMPSAVRRLLGLK